MDHIYHMGDNCSWCRQAKVTQEKTHKFREAEPIDCSTWIKCTILGTTMGQHVVRFTEPREPPIHPS
jgi:hypothetical protein